MSAIPAQITPEEFEEHIEPHLSKVKRESIFICSIPDVNGIPPRLIKIPKRWKQAVNIKDIKEPGRATS